MNNLNYNSIQLHLITNFFNVRYFFNLNLGTYGILTISLYVGPREMFVLMPIELGYETSSCGLGINVLLHFLILLTLVD